MLLDTHICGLAFYENRNWLIIKELLICPVNGYLLSAFDGDPSIMYLKGIHPPGLPFVVISLFLISGLNLIFILKIIILLLAAISPQLYYKISINVTKNEKIGLATAFLSITVPASINIFAIGSYSSIGAFLFLIFLYFLTLLFKRQYPLCFL